MKNKKQKKAVSYDANETITTSQYRSFQAAFDYFNSRLFSGSLPRLLITLQRHGGTNGYFAPNRFVGRAAGGDSTHELALNPDNFTGRTDEEVLSTLNHEMVHLWQQVYGHPPRRGYHNKEFAAEMKRIGLHPSSTGQPGGKETGGRITHYIIPDGPFAKAYRELAKTGFRLDWQSKPPDRKQRQSKTKFTCPSCGQNAWAKPDAKLLCAACGGAVPMTAATAPAEIADAA